MLLLYPSIDGRITNKDDDMYYLYTALQFITSGTNNNNVNMHMHVHINNMFPKNCIPLLL
jgi:hypothetical protein